MRSRISGVIFSILPWSTVKPAASTMGSKYPASSSTGRVRMWSELSQTALGSNGSSSLKLTTALLRLMPAKLKASTISWRVKRSRSSLGDHPSRLMKLMKACGRKPASRYVVTETTGPWRRFESLAPSGAVSNGRCANSGSNARGLENQNVLVGIREVVLAANDVADAKIRVVGAGGQMIGGHAIGAQQGEVFDIGEGLGLFAIDAVVEAHLAIAAMGHAESQGEGLT